VIWHRSGDTSIADLAIGTKRRANQGQLALAARIGRPYTMSLSWSKESVRRRRRTSLGAQQ
jgi:hypothetical protein